MLSPLQAASRFLPVLLLAVLPCTATAQIYKCVGPDGRVSYVQTPSASARCESAKTKAPPPGTSPNVESLNKFAEDSSKASTAAKQAREKQKEDAAIREARCKAARGELSFLDKEGASYFVIDDNGERQTVSEEQHRERVQRAREQVQEACGS